MRHPDKIEELVKNVRRDQDSRRLLKAKMGKKKPAKRITEGILTKLYPLPEKKESAAAIESPRKKRGKRQGYVFCPAWKKEEKTRISLKDK